MESDRYNSLSQILKFATGEHHIAVEREIDMARGIRSIEDYRAMLIRFWGIYRALEPALLANREVAVWLPDIQQRRRMPSLSADLCALNVNSEDLKVCRSVPDVRDISVALGCLY